jgi:hypothetical protein
MLRKIFAYSIILAIVIGFFLFVNRDEHSTRFIMISSSLAFLVFSLGIHGMIAYTLKPEFKGQLIFYPVWMWALWAMLFLLFVFLLLPAICPGFSAVP